jgi:uncharacterized membrane-anchored protein
VTGLLLVVALVLQFRAHRYIPIWYWLAVTLVSVFGTLVTDNLTDSLGVPLEASSLVFAALLALTFFVWYRSERTLSIHSIFTPRREGFYWLAILVTFALGTATGDLMAEALGLGYLVTGIIVAVAIAITALAWRLGLNPVLSFWIIYILTRPLGASIGDFLSQPSDHGGLGLGATLTSFIFLGGILCTVTYLSITKADVIPADEVVVADAEAERGGLWQTVAVVALVIIAAGTGYTVRKSSLDADTTISDPAAQSAADTNAAPQPIPSANRPTQPANGAAKPPDISPLGDMSKFRSIAQDTLNLLNNGDQAAATTRIGDLEIEWDDAEAMLKPKNKAAWTDVDGKIDTVLRRLRSTSPDPNSEKAALATLLTSLS